MQQNLKVESKAILAEAVQQTCFKQKKSAYMISDWRKHNCKLVGKRLQSLQDDLGLQPARKSCTGISQDWVSMSVWAPSTNTASQLQRGLVPASESDLFIATHLVSSWTEKIE